MMRNRLLFFVLFIGLCKSFSVGNSQKREEILSLMISESAVQNASLYLFSSLSLSIPK